jgi:perosamine synthetase
MSRDFAIPLSMPDIGPLEKEAVLRVLDSGRLSLGPELERFEASLCAAVGCRHAIAVNSGTSGLHLAVKATGIEPGDEVITSPFSFVASANCILYEQGVPVFADIDAQTYNLDPASVESLITSRTRAILPVHIFGRPCPLDSIKAAAHRLGLAVIEDACEALGARSCGKSVGTIGDSGVFAFYPNKQITTAEGGAIVTDDPEISRRCRSWRNQGRDGDGGWLCHQTLGYNYRLSDLQCALGTAQLSRLNAILARRASLADLYTEMLRWKVPDVMPPAPPAPDSVLSWFVYVVQLTGEFSEEQRDHVLDSLHSAGIGCNKYFTPIHLQPFYRERFGYQPGDFPVTEAVSARTIALPFFNRLSDGQIATVCDALAQAINEVRPLVRSIAAGSSLSWD